VLLDEPRHDEVLVRVLGVGICHTDLTFAGFAESPQVFGHEGAGIVQAVGSSVTQFQPGDKVIMSYAYCGSCLGCLSGDPGHCDSMVALNFAGTRTDGSRSITAEDGHEISGNFFNQSSFAQYALTSPRGLIAVPDDTPLEVLQLLGPLGCSVLTGAGGVIHALNVRAGDSIVVFGIGGVGLSAILGAVVSGAATVIAVDVNEQRLATALELGATHAFDARDDALLARIDEVTGGGADFGMDCSGNMTAVETVIAAVRMRGVVGLVGVGAPGSKISVDHVLINIGRTVMGITEGNAVPQDLVPKLLKLHLQGRLPFDQLIKAYPFEDIQSAADDSEHGRTVKSVLTFAL
jgi:aryl-alcohol dehydrogenase